MGLAEQANTAKGRAQACGRLAGFTLIELLIVVAIIAILAAIAVPNFLEAQTRAKVSRVKADMRSVATAMEAYAVDNNKYAIPSDSNGFWMGDPVTAITVSPFETRVPILLSTPIAYISSRPEDPFASQRFGESRTFHCVTHDYVQIRHNHAPAYNWMTIYRKFFLELTGSNPPTPILYFLVSLGPDRMHDADVPHTTAPGVPHEHGRGTFYDPTNGSISRGDIMYFGPGLGFWKQN
jgi:type II secretion system protein G